jgi:predicted phage terminase large subunit-like protein
MPSSKKSKVEFKRKGTRKKFSDEELAKRTARLRKYSGDVRPDLASKGGKIGMANRYSKEGRAKAEAESLQKTIEKQERIEENVARRELAQRELCRKKLLAYVLRFNPDYLAGWVHKDICARLERFMADVEQGKSPRLMIQMPPRHGKSTLASQEFPSWVLGHHPNWEIMSCSYAESLALDFSRAVRERLRDREYHVLFPKTRVDPENQNAKGWKTVKREGKKGGLLPAGVEGPLTGKGAHILIIDDPVKNATEAESETTRESVANWYSSTAYTRLAPGGGVLVIQTRWHMDDLSGRLEYKMREGRGDVFEIVRYPAVATEDEKFRKAGDPLHEARYSAAQLKMIKQAVGQRTWSALYQQNPVPDEGAMFQSSMLQYYNQDQLPEQLSFVSCWDLAIGQKEVNDKTVGMTWGKDITGDYWFVDCRRGHWDAYEIVDEICDNFVKWQPGFVGVEKDKVALAVGPYLDTEIENRELYSLHVEELPPAREGNKQHRARSLQGLMRRGRVWLPNPEEAPWVSEFVSELLQFPYGRRDDHVDAAAWLALQAADTPAPGFNYSRVPRRETWRDRLRGAMRGTKTMMSS